MVFRSKAKATKEEIGRISELHKAVTSTPVIAFGSAHAMTGGASADARRGFIRYINGIAKRHGLADQRGEWGFDLETGEFLSEYPIKENSNGT